MTNPTRTRAEIQAEIDRVVDKAFNAGRACAVFETNPCPITREYSVEAAYDLSKAQSGLETGIAADLIPREEHERALAEARKTISARDAVAYLVDEYQMDISPMDESPTPRPYTHIGRDMRHYRVTVERIDADHIGGSAEMVPDAVAATTSHGTAVAPKGVVQELYYLSNEMNMSDAQGWAWLVDKAVDRITELPEPNVNLVSYTAKDRVVRVVSLSGWYISLQDSNEALQLAANCIKAAELLREAKRDGEGE